MKEKIVEQHEKIAIELSIAQYVVHKICCINVIRKRCHTPRNFPTTRTKALIGLVGPVVFKAPRKLVGLCTRIRRVDKKSGCLKNRIRR